MDENKVNDIEKPQLDATAEENKQTETATAAATAQEAAATAEAADTQANPTAAEAETAEHAAEAKADTADHTAEAAPAEGENADAEDTKEKKTYNLPDTKAGVVDRLKEIVASGNEPERNEVELLKQTYYKIHNAEATKAREEFIANGGDAESFTPPVDEEEAAFKAEMGRIREIRAQAFEAAEKEKQDNLDKKLEIIEKIKGYAASPEEADKHYDDVKKLQAEWKEIKQVPAEKATELWKNYQLYTEQFYDQLRLNHEFRAYDFKKNLEIKTHLCEAAEKLADVADPVSAFHQLQKLHQEFREAGPVAKELREEIWNRFKAASTAVNKRHQEHFEQLKAQEEENLAKKTALCEKVEAISTDGVKSFTEWDKLTKEVLDIQAEWKTIGFTPKKMNSKIFERFRAACDKFFSAKSAYFKATRETFAENLEKKNALCEQAEALKESTDWNDTANKLIALQKEWRTIGPVARKVSDTVWKRFNKACNDFFDRKNEATSGQRKEEEANLEKKNSIIERLEKLLEEKTDDVREQVRQLQAEWNETGHVPFRKKEKMYKKYREVCDRIFEELHISAGRRNLENFKKNVAEKGGNELSREKARLTAAFEAKKQEIQNYETNLSFFNSKSKSGNSLVEEINKKIDRLKDDLNLIAEKIKALNEKPKAEPAKAAEASEDKDAAEAPAAEAALAAADEEQKA